MQKITPIILAGGLGTRLRPIVSDRPKVLAPVNGRPFIAFLFDQLVSAGFTEVVLCTGHIGVMIQESLGKSYEGLEIRYSQEVKPLGTGGALRLAVQLGILETVLVMNGDSYVDTDIHEFIEWHMKEGHKSSMLLIRLEENCRYGNVEVDKDGYINRFQEKESDAASGWINAGIYILEKEIIEGISTEKPCSLEYDVFPKLINSGLYGYCCGGEFIDIGTPESYVEAQEFFRNIELKKRDNTREEQQ